MGMIIIYSRKTPGLFPKLKLKPSVAHWPLLRMPTSKIGCFPLFSKRANQNGLWIGLHRIRKGGPFAWVTEGQTNYFDWASGEPNDTGGIENCVHMRNGTSDNGTWNDISDDALLNGIVELPGKAEDIHLSKSEQALIGTWYVGGNLQQPCWIAGTDNALFVILNCKFAARAGICADGTLFVDGWTTDLGDFGPSSYMSFPQPQIMHGEIIEGKILWSNGTWWSRESLVWPQKRKARKFLY